MRSSKFGSKLILLVLLSSFLFGCGHKVNEGSFEEGIYSSDYFKFSLSVPEEWLVLDDDDVTSLLDVTQSALGDEIDRNIEKQYHIMFFGGDYLPREGFSCSLLITAQDIKAKRELSDPYQYLQEVSYEELEALYGDGLSTEPVTKEMVDKEEFYSKTYLVKTPDGDSFSQTMVVGIKRKHLLSFILTYDTDEQYRCLIDEVLASVRFRK